MRAERGSGAKGASKVELYEDYPRQGAGAGEGGDAGSSTGRWSAADPGCGVIACVEELDMGRARRRAQGGRRRGSLDTAASPHLCIRGRSDRIRKAGVARPIDAAARAGPERKVL